MDLGSVQSGDGTPRRVVCAFLREQTLVCSADSLQKGPAVPTLSGSMRSSEESGMVDHHRRTNVPRPWVLQMQGPVYVR